MATITQEIEFNRYELTSVTDFRNDGFATARVQLFNGDAHVKDHELTLWSGDDYTNAGQWTDKDIDARILLLLNL